MRARALPVLSLALLAACASGPTVYKVQPFPYEGFSATYPTGMRLVVFELAHMPEVMVSASYRVGSIDDPPGKTGMAHLVEHLTFRARPGGGARLWDRYDALGVEFNALTYPDSTEYVAICPADELERVLALEAARLRDPLGGLTEKDFSVEREVVLRELAERRDPASSFTHLEWLTQKLAPASPYARVPTEESVRAITLDDVRAFVRAHYTPAHLLLVVTGPRQGAAVGRSSFQTFGVLAAGAGGAEVKPVAISPPELVRALPPEEVEVREAPVDRPLLWVAWAVPGDAKYTQAKAMMAARFLGNAIGEVSLQHGNRRKIRSVSTTVRNSDGLTIVAARVELRDPDDGPGLFRDIRAMRDFRGGIFGVDPVEAYGVRTALLMNAHLDLEALEQVGIASFIRATGRVDYIGEWPKLVAFTLSDEDGTKAFMNEHTRSERLAGILVVPSDAASPVPTASAPGATDVSGVDHHGAMEPELPPGDPLTVPRIPELAHVVRKRLGNGAELVLAPRPGFRAVAMGAYTRTDPGSMAGDSLRWFALWSTECAFGASVSDAFVSFEMREPTDLIPEKLRRFPCLDIRPQLAGPDFDVLKREWLAHLQKFPPSRRERATAAFLSRLFPGHPYGDVLLTPAHLEALKSGDASRWLKGAIRPERTTFVASGDVVDEPEELAYFERRFGDWKAAAPPVEASMAEPPLPAARTVLLSNRPGWTTAELHVGLRAPPRARRDEPAFRAVTWRLSHDLNARLRTTSAVTYGVSVELLERSLGSALLLATVVPADQATRTLAEILGHVGGLSEPFDGLTLSKARWQVARQFTLGFGTAARNRDRLGELALHGLPDDEWTTFVARTASLTPERVTTQVAALGLDREIVLVVGDARVLEPALRARGLQIEVLPDAAPAR